MPLFGKQFFKSEDARVEDAYKSGVSALSGGDYQSAYEFFNRAADGGHASAFYNLFLIHGGGYISTYDLDAAADAYYKAAAAGHPKAKEQLFLLEAADRAGFGYDHLAQMAGNSVETGYLPSILIMCGARFTQAVCAQFGATTDVIAYELDAAATSDKAFVQAFVRRTGIHSDVYRGGMNRLVEGSAADQITDGLNQFSVAMIQSGINRDLALMARCTIVGYVIRKSHLRAKSLPLYGVKKFLSAA